MTPFLLLLVAAVDNKPAQKFKSIDKNKAVSLPFSVLNPTQKSAAVYTKSVYWPSVIAIVSAFCQFTSTGSLGFSLLPGVWVVFFGLTVPFAGAFPFEDFLISAELRPELCRYHRGRLEVSRCLCDVPSNEQPRVGINVISTGRNQACQA